jgi:hypothetical protein
MLRKVLREKITIYSEKYHMPQVFAVGKHEDFVATNSNNMSQGCRESVWANIYPKKQKGTSNKHFLLFESIPGSCPLLVKR